VLFGTAQMYFILYSLCSHYRVYSEYREENQDKRKLPPGATVNIRSEQEPNSKRRTYHSRNC